MGEQPIRWTLDGSGAPDLLTIAEGPVMDVPVRVREDRATPADVEAVARWFAGLRSDDAPAGAHDRACAASVLAAVFPDSKAEHTLADIREGTPR
jgi:hypothetical protein